MAGDTKSILWWDPELLARAESLEWRSRLLVEGFLQGAHRSRLHGFSSEFAQYHAYMPGDDLRYLDWKAYARSDRLFVREFEAETNLRCQIVVDASASMGYKSGKPRFTKYQYSCLFAAALMRLMRTQNDAFGLAIAQSGLANYVPPRLGNAHFLRCLGAMEAAKIQGTVDLNASLYALGELLPKRSLIVIFTDGWDTLERLTAGMQRLCYDHHEVCLMQVVDPQELDFDFEESRVFEDPETALRLPITPTWNKSRYLSAIATHLEQLENLSRDMGASYSCTRTSDSPYVALAEFLLHRGRGRQR